jgi:flagellar P-ring protein precursor FlgI
MMTSIFGMSSASAVETRIKDISRIDGLHTVNLIGYGVVIGLSGTGDKDIELTKQTMANLLESFQLSLSSKDIKSKNVAVVVVTASAPPFHREGDKIDIQVSSLGDASSLEGGVLMMTPLLDPEGQLYGLAQGGITVGGYSAGAGGPGGQTATKNYTTVGYIPNGATLRHTQLDSFVQNGSFRIVLRQPDFTTANRMAEIINERSGGMATAVDAGSVTVKIPDKMADVGQVVSFISSIEILSVVPDSQARVIVNERTGTIVMGADVHIGQAVIAHGNLTVRIGSSLSTYMPAPFSEAKPVVTEKIATEAAEDKANIMLLNGTATVRDLADMLNQMGSTPRDLISILEALQKLGALQMELVTM